MKKIVFSLTLLIFVLNSFCQTSKNKALTKDYYLQKSKNQKTAAWVLLGGGLGIAATGGIVQLIHENQSNNGSGLSFDFTGTWIAIGGGVVALSSIPFFIGSSKNKKKAASIAISNQNIFLPRQNSFALKTQPTFTLKIGL